MTVRVTRRRIVVTAVVITLFLLLTGFAFQATSTTAFCGLCHTMKATVAGYEHSPHKRVNCEQCHTKPGPFFFLTAKLEALQEPVKQLNGNYETPILGTVQSASCRRCHTDKELFPTISKGGINVNHKHLIEAGYQCITCHSTVAHGNAVPQGSRTYPAMDKCLVCHNNRYTAADGTVATGQCDICHVRPAQGSKPDSHTADWLQIHGTNGILSTCTACHPAAPGAAAPAGGWDSSEDCTTCHRGVLMPHPTGWLQEHGPESKHLGARACAMCHDVKTYCIGCHQVPLPHPKDFVSAHPAYARQNAATCFNCHSVDNCNACHSAHQQGTPQAHDLFGSPAPAAQTPAGQPSPTTSGTP
jgi:nitrate/TMAO reductase-like tetraheme cytochrome c subunit